MTSAHASSWRVHVAALLADSLFLAFCFQNTESATGKQYIHGEDRDGHPVIYQKPRYENTKDYDQQVSENRGLAHCKTTSDTPDTPP